MSKYLKEALSWPTCVIRGCLVLSLVLDAELFPLLMIGVALRHRTDSLVLLVCLRSLDL